MHVDANLPDDPKELFEEYLKRSKELKELRSDPEQIRGRIDGIYERYSRLRQIEEGTYAPSPDEDGIITEPLFDDDGEFLGVIQDIDDPYLTAQEKFAREEIDRLKREAQWLENRLDFIRIRAAARGIMLPDESAALSVKPEESERRNPRGAGRPRDPDVERRRQMMFLFLREQRITNKEDAAKHIRQMDFRERLYDYFDEQGVEMIDSENYSEIRNWAGLKRTAEDLQAADYLIKDMRRNWDRLWNSQG